MELVIALALAAVAGLALPRGRLRWGALAALALGAGALAAVRPSPPPDLDRYRPADATADQQVGYASSRACRACHADAYETWHATHHRQMTQAVTPQTVLAAFDGQMLTDGPRSYRVFREGDGFFVDMPRYGTNGETEDTRMVRPVVMSTGSHHMQAYWIPSPLVDERPARVGRLLFNRICTGCHGTDGHAKGELRALRDAMLLPYEIEAALGESAHADVAVPDDGHSRHEIVRFVTRIQVTGRLMQFPFVWLVREGRWVNEEHTFLQPPYSPAPVEIWGDAWSDGCDQCHSVRPSYDWQVATQRADAAVAELGIACEACHGPGRAHVERHRAPTARYAEHFGGAPPADDIVQPARLGHREASAVCGQCHAEMVVHDPSDRFAPGRTLESHGGVVQFTPEAPPSWLAPILEDEPKLLVDAFWTDGTIRIAGRNYNAQALSGCYTRGAMSCLTCHSMHHSAPSDQLKGPAVDDSPCVGCHPSVAADVQAHTHHPPESSGSRCYNCHMPHTTVGLLTLMRSHRIDSPSAVRAAWSGRPDACSLCHIDRTLPAIAKTMTEWYGHDVLPAIADDRGASAVVAWALRGDAVQRATAAWHMGWAPALSVSGSDWQIPYLALLLDDPYAAVRAIAIDALRRHPGFGDFAYDYVAPSPDRQARAQAAVERWHGAGPPADRPSAFIVDGRIDQAAVEVLFERRDDTEVRVNE